MTYKKEQPLAVILDSIFTQREGLSWIILLSLLRVALYYSSDFDAWCVVGSSLTALFSQIGLT